MNTATPKDSTRRQSERKRVTPAKETGSRIVNDNGVIGEMRLVEIRTNRLAEKGGNNMRHATVGAAAAIIGIMFLFVGSASAQQKLAEQVAKGCDQEIKTYCKDVTQGEGRILACLYAYGDKISGKCEYALYDAAVQLERAVNALAYTANECRDDLKTFCSGIEPGGGRLLQCLDKNRAKVSSRCQQALKETGLK